MLVEAMFTTDKRRLITVCLFAIVHVCRQAVRHLVGSGTVLPPILRQHTTIMILVGSVSNMNNHVYVRNLNTKLT